MLFLLLSPFSSFLSSCDLAVGLRPDNKEAQLAAASSDFTALEKLRKLVFAEQVPEPARQLLLPIETIKEDNEFGEV
jgi:hypothetical protein